MRSEADHQALELVAHVGAQQNTQNARAREDDLQTALNDCQRFKSNNAAVKQHQAILTFGSPKLNEYLIAGDGIEVNGMDVSNRLVLLAYDLEGALCNLAYITPNQPTVFAYQNHEKRGFYSFNNPVKNGFAYVVIDMVAAFKISAAGLPCILIAPIAAQHGAPVQLSAAYEYQLKAAIRALQHHQIKTYCPVACHEKNDYARTLEGLGTPVLGMEASLGVYDDTNSLNKYLNQLTTDFESYDLSWSDTNNIESDDNLKLGAASKLIVLANEHCQFIHDADGEAYAIIKTLTSHQCYKLDSKSFKEWLSYQYYKTEERAPSDKALSDAIGAMTGKAKFEGVERSIHIRTAKHEGVYYVDLCNDEWQAVAISATGWKIVDSSPALFTRTNSMRPLPTPEHGKGDITQLWQFLNVAENDRLMLLAWLLECFRPDTPYPLLEISGEAGSAKSSTQSKIRQLVDPNKANLRTVPKNKDDLFVSAKNSHLVSFENVSFLTTDYQDALCILATGGGFAGRTLYTNSEETTFELKKPIVLNGIPCVITAQDLLDRTIHFDVPVLEQITEEATIADQWCKSYPVIFSGLLDLFVSALAIIPSVDLRGEKLPRMADFTRLGEAVYQALGRPPKAFLNEYRSRRADGVNRTIDASPVAVAIVAYLDKNPNGFVGTVGELLDILIEYREDNDSTSFPKSAKGFGDVIQRLKPSLRQIGIDLWKDSKRSKNGFKCSLKRLPPQGEILKVSSPSTPYAPHVHSVEKNTDSTAEKMHMVNKGVRDSEIASQLTQYSDTPSDSANDAGLFVKSVSTTSTKVVL